MGTHRTYKLAVTVFKRWLKKEKNIDDLSFSRFTSELAREFKSYLEVDLGNSPATITNRFAAFKSMLTTARDEEIVDASFRPLAGIKVRGKKSKKQIPSREEVAQFSMLDVDPNRRVWHTRNLYLFCVNMAGLRFGDAVSLRWANVVDDRLQWQTSKTNKQRLIYIPQEVREILDLYRNENGPELDENAFIFPFLKGNEHLRRSQLNKPIQVANTNCNLNLKSLWKQSGSAKYYSFHTSRHFFATDSLRRGMRVEVLQHLLTHSTLNQTMEYAQIANEDMDAAMKAYEAAKQA
jgi:integrase